MTDRHPSNGRFVAGSVYEGSAVAPTDRPDAGRAAQSPANTGERRGTPWPALSEQLTGPAPAVVPSRAVPMEPRPEHPESSGAGLVNVQVQRLDLRGSGPILSRPPFHTAPIEPEADRD